MSLTQAQAASASEDAELRERLFLSDVEHSRESPCKVEAANGDADVKTQSGSLLLNSSGKTMNSFIC